MNDDRARAWTNVYPTSLGMLHADKETAEEFRCYDALRTIEMIEMIEIREGETIVTREMREKIEYLMRDAKMKRENTVGTRASDVFSGRRQAIEMVLDILDGKDGQ